MTLSSEDYLDALLKLPIIYDYEGAQASPNGQYVAWTWMGAGETMDVYTVPTDGSSPPIQLTDNHQDVMFVSWTPDSQAVIVCHDFDGNERVQLFRVDITQPTIMHPLTDANPDYYIFGGVLHPNGKWLIYNANLDIETGAEMETATVFRHDLETGKRVALAKLNSSSRHEPKLNTAGTHILYTRRDRHPSGWQIWIVGIDGSDDHEIINAGDQKKVTWASWTPDGQHILFIAETDTYYRLGLWTLAGESIRWLIDDPARNIEKAFLSAGTPNVAVIETRNAKIKSSFLNIASGSETSLADMRGNLTPLAPLKNGSLWVGEYYASTHPMDIVVFDPRTPANFQSLTRIWERTPLTPQDLTPAEDFRWQADDGREIQGWLYHAKGTPKGTIVHVHGGPTYHSPDWIDYQLQFFAAQGFNVLDPNYRGSTGFSREYKEAIKIDGWGGAEQTDIRAGIEALIKAGIAEPYKVGITGTSYGGYSAWCAITRYPLDIIAAAAPICGMTDLVVDYETTRPDLRPYSEEMMGGSPSEIPDRYRERSPLYFVENMRGKLLIVQGLRDPNVTPENVTVVEEALQTAGIPYELLTFEDEGHGIERIPNQKILYLRLATFFAAAFGTE